MTGRHGHLAPSHSKVRTDLSNAYTALAATQTDNATEFRRATGDLHEEVEVILHPKPTNDPNDPLV